VIFPHHLHPQRRSEHIFPSNPSTEAQIAHTKTHTYAEVMSADGKKIALVSTREAYIRENLYGCNNVSASRNVGRVLAQRLKEGGIATVAWDRQGRRFHGACPWQRNGLP
jgi:large subunit ribosomal protein L18